MSHINMYNLPNWDDCDKAIKSGNYTPLELFLRDQEPAGKDEILFREQLSAILIPYQVLIEQFVQTCNLALKKLKGKNVMGELCNPKEVKQLQVVLDLANKLMEKK